MTLPALNLITSPLPPGAAVSAQNEGSTDTSFAPTLIPYTNAAIPANKSQEGPAVVFAPPQVPFGNVLVLGRVASMNPGAALAAGIAYSHSRVTGPGGLVFGHGNMTAAPLGTGAVDNWTSQFPNLKRSFTGGVVAGSNEGPALTLGYCATLPVTPGAIGAGLVVEASVGGAFINANQFVACVPNAALPPGIAISHVRATAADIVVGFANLTAAPIVVGAISLDFCLLAPLTALPPDISTAKDGQNGPLSVFEVSGVSVTHGPIAAGTVVEATAPLVNSMGEPLCQNGDVLVVSPRATPDPLVLVSHARPSASGVVSVGLGNLDLAAPVTPGALLYDFLVLRGYPAN